MTPDLIRHAYLEYQLINGSDLPISEKDVTTQRTQSLERLQDRLPTFHLDWQAETLVARLPLPELTLCPGLNHPFLVVLHNQTKTDVQLVATLTLSERNANSASQTVVVGSDSALPILFHVAMPNDGTSISMAALQFETHGDDATARVVSIPVRTVQPGLLRISTLDSLNGSVAASRVTVACSDGVSRYGGEYAEKSTFTDKPIIYPPIQTWQKTPFFYTEGQFDITVPPGPTSITVERGFEHERRTVTIDVVAGETRAMQLVCQRVVDMQSQGWISGDTHVHWVTNQWNVDEPLELLALAQRAEDLRVANNLTLLQRYASQAFIKPSHAAMGPISKFSDSMFHIQMGEEYRNEDLYGHLCFLNIDWMVQPIGTGSIIAGPDSLDYPINRTAIDACREQGGLSIEAHGTGGNKDVPVNVIHNLSDSLDQMEPEMYYRLLDCGFRVPLSNGSDHPARTLGVARVYVHIDQPFSYANWIEGIRQGRTFTTSGPLLSLTVNDASIGDVIHTGGNEMLRIHAEVLAREPIGRFQIVSNGKVVAEKFVEGTTAEIDLTLPAEESRWIVARCSRRTDGRADFGFGDFNAITGPGIAHTSPVYVQVDGQPRFDSAAATYWADRMRLHAMDIETSGRFANDSQRSEAVGYIQQGITMFQGLKQQIASARAHDESIEDAKIRLGNVVRRFGYTAETTGNLNAIALADSRLALTDALEPLTLVTASISPESRVKIAANRDRIELVQGRPQRFLIRVENTAGITAPLGIQAVDIASDPPQTADWCEIHVIDSPFSSMDCTGATREFKVIEILSRAEGLREIRLVADVGQGTQDLGFRATADIQLQTTPRRSKDEYEN
jgi:hypothetical protein